MVAAAAAMFMSCQKDATADQMASAESSATPHIIFSKNNIVDIPIPMQPGSYSFPLTSDVVVFTAPHQDPSMSGISLWPCRGDVIQDGPYGVPDALRFNFGSRPSHTCDATFIIAQPLSGAQTRYTSYGIIETFVNFRIEGTDGAFYLDPSETDKLKPNHLSACASNPYAYIIGEVKGFGQVYEEKRTYVLARNWAAQGDYDAGYLAEVVPVTIESNGVEVTLLVHGKKRDGDMAALLSYIKVGDTIEAKVPATAYDREKPSVLRDFLTCHILKKN